MAEKIERYHDLDALRGTMLLLGLVVHASQGYLTDTNELRDPLLWYFYDSTSSPIMAVLCGAIHVYRMPVFFVLAGFFAALLMAKRGLGSLMVNRIKRVAAPLAVAMISVIPLIYVTSKLAWSNYGGAPNGLGVQTNIREMIVGNLCHLWFLWHLVLFYLVTAFVVIVFQKTKLNQLARPLFDRIVNSNFGVVVCVVISIAFLSQMKTLPGNLDTSFSFAPPWYLLGIYFFCYCYGWILFSNRTRLKELGEKANLRMAMATTAVALYLITLGWYLNNGRPNSLNWILVLLSAISIWSMVEGWLALFQKYFRNPSRWSRYLSDSSYWVYLIHVPVVLALQGFLANVKIAAELKFSIVVFASTAVCLLSYHLLVRATPIGVFLNGRRYPIWPEQMANSKSTSAAGATSPDSI